ncbi:MAG: hypothetical protein MI923_30230 [Phycisphaerales bacterium]|nr:hypothetical protein [Phycisphaerales bacterium]
MGIGHRGVLIVAVWFHSLKVTAGYYVSGIGGFGWGSGYLCFFGAQPTWIQGGWFQHPSPAYQWAGRNPDVFPWPPLVKMGKEVGVCCWLLLTFTILFTV